MNGQNNANQLAVTTEEIIAVPSALQNPSSLVPLIPVALLNANEKGGALRETPALPSSFDPLDLHGLFTKTFTQMLNQPHHWMEATQTFWMDALTLARTGLHTLHSREATLPVLVDPLPGDRRFKEPAWKEMPAFNMIMQSYLLFARWSQDLLAKVEGLDEIEAKKVRFYAQHFLDAFSPSNCPWTNPKVLNKALETQGESLIQGLSQLLQDIQQGLTISHIKNVDTETFQVGKNLATTPGKVIFQNELMQLIQYSPTTEHTYEVPLLIIPAWINKFYIFDLQEHNSFIKWALNQGLTVFIISWVNPSFEHASKTFEDYMKLGPLAALDIIRMFTGQRQVNVMGHCLGGILLSCVLGYLGEKAKDCFKSATFLTPLFDFSKAGDLMLFAGEDYLRVIQDNLNTRGYLEGATLAATFNMLRPNDLIWSSFINTYLLAEDLPRLDFLFWNADNTNLPAAMYKFYIREFFQKNALMYPGQISLLGEPIDLQRVSLPTFILSTKEDHIAPWTSGYAGTHLFKENNTFVLAGSGHIAGVINPPTQEKYGYWINDDCPAKPEDWLASAAYNQGSWWRKWSEWISAYGGDIIPARYPRDSLEDAPGSYVYKKWNAAG